MPEASCGGFTPSALPMFSGAIPGKMINSYLEELQEVSIVCDVILNKLDKYCDILVLFMNCE